MILDRLAHAERYFAVHALFARTFQFLREIKSPPPERQEIDGAMLYAVISRQGGKPQNEAFLEAHRRYIDVHYCIEGVEHIGWSGIEKCNKADKPYSENDDFMTFANRPEAWVTLTPGSFAVFFPEDAHAPMVSDGIVHKVVVKVAV
jgi:biofilm protein TabA